MNVVLLSNHANHSRRKAGFHHLAEALHAMGHTVTFVTTGLSLISYARKDFRTMIEGIREQFGRSVEVKPGFHSYVHFTRWHPHSLVLPWLNNLTAGLMDRYADYPLGNLEPVLTNADMIIYESCAALFLFRKAKALAPYAKHVYRVSDDIAVMRSTHPRLIELEREIAPQFDLISVPYRTLFDKFSYAGNTVFHGHGLNKELFSTSSPSPYTTGNNCVYVGIGFFDYGFIDAASRLCPDAHFHLIGPLTPSTTAPNVHWYGEKPFAETIPYIQHADVGLQIIVGKDMKVFQDTLKIVQYRYCGLPIVVNSEMRFDKEGFFHYDTDDESSMQQCVYAALQSGKDMSRSLEVQSWQQIAEKIINDPSGDTTPRKA